MALAETIIDDGTGVDMMVFAVGPSKRDDGQVRDGFLHSVHATPESIAKMLACAAQLHEEFKVAMMVAVEMINGK